MIGRAVNAESIVAALPSAGFRSFSSVELLGDVTSTSGLLGECNSEWIAQLYTYVSRGCVDQQVIGAAESVGVAMLRESNAAAGKAPQYIITPVRARNLLVDL